LFSCDIVYIHIGQRLVTVPSSMERDIKLCHFFLTISNALTSSALGPTSSAPSDMEGATLTLACHHPNHSLHHRRWSEPPAQPARIIAMAVVRVYPRRARRRPPSAGFRGDGAAGWRQAPGLCLASVGGGLCLSVPLGVVVLAAIPPPRHPGCGRLW
jgi:hypothetical protein